MADPVNVLFLCTGNSCRSQIAEGWARHIGGDAVSVESAGIEAHGKNPHAIKVMREIGVELGITTRTVAFHKYRMMDDLNISSSAELIQFAVKHGLVSS